ncbi:glucose-1-phosphate thymidylyltransferase [Streptomyces yaizuensis]|uniref:Glucose-1-phosphate thymidylyltransferase n=1 Tax=Streptomyces yaizuensis TaxID=2989713 RepID=A0ABQ5PA12_9ACTN|nr:glucose-1-phosphate thymidylyltransferase [Streptomyces sp. YSPA8]
MAGKAVLEHVLDNIVAAGVTDIGIIVGDQAERIGQAIGDGSRFGARITYLRQDQPLGLAHCVTVARDFLGDDDFLMYLGDNILPEGIGGIVRGFAAERPDARIVVQKVADPSAFGVAEIDAHGVVGALVEKPVRPRSDLALIGLYFFTPVIHEAVAAIEPSARGELEITDAIQWLVTRGRTVTAVEYTGYWQDTGNVDAVLDCNRRLLDRLTASRAGEIDADSTVTGPVVVEAGAKVVRSRIEGPAVIGAGTLVEDSRIGRYTAIGRDCAVRDTRIGASIVQDGTTLTGLHGLSDSLIGRSASVRAGSHHRLIVGDDSEVEIAR